MELPSFPFRLIDWSQIAAEEHKGITGFARWKTLQLANIRIRFVEYSPGYKADHWCSKGHIIYCIAGEMDTELKDGRVYRLQAGISYIVGDGNEPHCSFSSTGCKLFIVD